MRRFRRVRLVDAGLLSGFLVRARLRAARPYLTGSVLDYACGHGQLAQLCAPESYTGYDIDSRKLDVARGCFPGYRFRSALPAEERFDVVAALAFIEHVEPETYLKQFADLLRHNGRIVLTTPHPAFEWIHTAGARLRIFSPEAHDDHEGLVSSAAISEIAGRLSLRVLRKRRFLLGANQLFVLVRA
jgi:2-polyprenyl-3-methyl-5-hydroxy-6-metoxy-1,4-benzoquinol methylase